MKHSTTSSRIFC